MRTAHSKRGFQVATTMAIGTSLFLSGACGSGHDEQQPQAPRPNAPMSASDKAIAANCPNPIVMLTTWFPQPLEAAPYQLVGPGGRIDERKGRYSGVVGNSGVTLTVQSGGPYLGSQTPSSVMYQDDSILLGSVGQDNQIELHGKTPTVGVMVNWQNNPLGLSFNPDKLPIESFADIKNSGATVLHYNAVSWVPYLLEKGYVRKSQLDSSLDGSYSRIVAEPGKIVVQSALTNDPWRLKHQTAWRDQPLKTLPLKDAGYNLYQTWAVRKDKLKDTKTQACLKALVPLLQRATVDYVAAPATTNKTLVEVADAFGTFWKLSPDLVRYGHKVIVEQDIYGNGPDGALGKFAPSRVDAAISTLQPIYAKQSRKGFDPTVTASDVYTNRFIDPDVGIE